MEKDGLTIVYTGKGKGKTTAALGIALRATGYKKKICMIQFIKGSWHYGEMDSSKRLEPEFEMVAIGKGFVGIIDDKSPKVDHQEVAKEAMKISNEKIQSGKYDIVILDEINYAVNLNLVPLDDVLNLIKAKPQKVDLVLTGNYAKKEVIEAAESFGASKKQKLWGVQLPLALPNIMQGINQCTMMALAMVVIASMIGTRGLGDEVLLGLQQLNVGSSLEAGLAIVLLAIVFDRITQAYGEKIQERTQPTKKKKKL